MMMNEIDFSSAYIGDDFIGRPIFNFFEMIGVVMADQNIDRADAVEWLEYRLSMEYENADYIVMRSEY